MKKFIKTLFCIVLSMCMLFVVACDGGDTTGGGSTGGGSTGGDTPPEVVKPTVSTLMATTKASLDKGSYTMTIELSDDDSIKFVLKVVNGDDGFVDKLQLTNVTSYTDPSTPDAEPTISTNMMFIYGNNTLYALDSVDENGVEYFTATVMEDKFKASMLIDFMAGANSALVENEGGSYTLKTEVDPTTKINLYYNLIKDNLDKTVPQLIDILLGGDGGAELTEYYAMLDPIVTAISTLHNNSMLEVISMLDTLLVANEMTLEMVLDMIPNAYAFLNPYFATTADEVVITDYTTFMGIVTDMPFHTFVEKMTGLDPMETPEDFKDGLVTFIDATIANFTYGTVGETIEAYCTQFGVNYHEYINKMIEYDTKINTIKFGGELNYDKDAKFTGFKFNADIVIDQFPEYFEEIDNLGAVTASGFKPIDIDIHSFVSVGIDYTTQVNIVMPSEEQIVVPTDPTPNPTPDPTPDPTPNPDVPTVQSNILVKAMMAKLTNNSYSFI